jgi:hypothetical protein
MAVNHSSQLWSWIFIRAGHSLKGVLRRRSSLITRPRAQARCNARDISPMDGRSDAVAARTVFGPQAIMLEQEWRVRRDSAIFLLRLNSKRAMSLPTNIGRRMPSIYAAVDAHIGIAPRKFSGHMWLSTMRNGTSASVIRDVFLRPSAAKPCNGTHDRCETSAQ